MPNVPNTIEGKVHTVNTYILKLNQNQSEMGNYMDMNPEDFNQAGHELVDRITKFLEDLPNKKVTKAKSPSEIRELLKDHSLPMSGQNVNSIIGNCAEFFFENSLFNGHPRFWGYITSSAAPIGALADLLAASVNANVGAFALSPVATEIERQSVRWLAELIGYPVDCGGLFVSGGNMANFLGFLAARKNKIPGDIRKEGLPSNVPESTFSFSKKDRIASSVNGKRMFTVYCAKGTHTWVQKATDLFGLGTNAIRWIDVTEDQQMDLEELTLQIDQDIDDGNYPFLVVGNAGTVSTGTVDRLREMSLICKNRNLWFHVDGAYGAPAACLPENTVLFDGLSEADSIALDPHKWLYSPLEAGCVMVRDAVHLREAFSYTPDYYNFEGDESERPVNFHEYGLQNSRGFRALKVWMSLRQTGRQGITEMIRKDIHLAKSLYEMVSQTSELEAVSHHLSITTFRYVPADLSRQDQTEFLNNLNELLVDRLQGGGEVFLSNALISGLYCLRVCIVNFRTQKSDLEALIQIVLKEGRDVYQSMPLE